jgi:hypothetical protein
MPEQSSPASLAKRALLFLLGATAGVMALIFLDVQISLAAIDPDNPATWPRMGPEIRYLFAPVLLLFVLGVAAVADPVIRVCVSHAALARPKHIVLLGLCYSLALMALPLRAILPPHPASLLIGPIFAIASATALRILDKAVRHKARSNMEKPDVIDDPPDG